MLTYCQNRGVSEDGRISCRKIVRGDQEVSLAVCESCPAAAANCGHLRFSLEKEGESSIVLRYGNGRSEILEGGPAGVHFTKSACAAQLRQVEPHRDCAGCPMRGEAFVRQVLPPVRTDTAAIRAKVIPFPSRLSERGQ
jgi:hypothetical protein